MDWKGNSGRVHVCPVEVKKIRTKVRFYKPKTLEKANDLWFHHISFIALMSCNPFHDEDPN